MLSLFLQPLDGYCPLIVFPVRFCCCCLVLFGAGCVCDQLRGQFDSFSDPFADNRGNGRNEGMARVGSWSPESFSIYIDMDWARFSAKVRSAACCCNQVPITGDGCSSLTRRLLSLSFHFTLFLFHFSCKSSAPFLCFSELFSANQQIKTSLCYFHDLSVSVY